jgi:hypothetical protein
LARSDVDGSIECTREESGEKLALVITTITESSRVKRYGRDGMRQREWSTFERLDKTLCER